MNKIGIHALVWAGSWGARECEYAVPTVVEHVQLVAGAHDIRRQRVLTEANRHRGTGVGRKCQRGARAAIVKHVTVARVFDHDIMRGGIGI